MDRKMRNMAVANDRTQFVRVIKIEDFVKVFNSLREDVQHYLSESYLGINSCDLRGQARTKNRDYRKKLDLFHKHKEYLRDICGNQALRGRCNPDMYYKSVDYLVNVMARLM